MGKMGGSIITGNPAMPKYQDTFKLDLNDINLIESALYEFMSQKLQDSYVRNRQSLQSAPPQVRNIQALLGKLHNQKVFYGQVNSVAAPMG